MSRVITQKSSGTTQSMLVKATKDWSEDLKKFSIEPKGVFGSTATVKCGNVTIKSDNLDIEFTVPFDDDMEANEAEIIVYNLSTATINNLKIKSGISIEAGYKNDTGVIFKGFINKVTTRHEGADKITTIKCLDDVTKRTVENLSFAQNTKASYILKTLIGKTGIPTAVFKMRRDYTYKNEQTVDGDLMENIKKYAQVCGVSVYVNKGKIYARHIKDGDNINFTVQASTGMIGSPEPYEKEMTAEDFKETINGYNITMLLQHRMTTAAIINLSSEIAKGKFRVISGTHTFSSSECTTTISVF